MVDQYCEGCYFRTYLANLGWHCDYLLIAGRIRPCESGEGCTVRILGKRAGDGSIEERRQLLLRGRKKTEEEMQAERERQLAAKRAYNREYYAKNRERNLALQRARRERAKAEKPATTPKDQVEKWRSGKARTAAKTKERWQGRQSAAIKQWKAEHFMTYGDMAERLGVDSTTVMKWANEANNADWTLLAKLGIEKPEEPAKIEKTAIK